MPDSSRRDDVRLLRSRGRDLSHYCDFEIANSSLTTKSAELNIFDRPGTK